MKSGMIALVLAALLVAMLVPAFAVTADNGAFALMLGTKINVQEEVGGTFTAENMTALAVVPNEAQAASTNMMTDSEAIIDVALYGHNAGRLSNYEPTPGAGGDGLLARHF